MMWLTAKERKSAGHVIIKFSTFLLSKSDLQGKKNLFRAKFCDFPHLFCRKNGWLMQNQGLGRFQTKQAEFVRKWPYPVSVVLD